MASIDHICPNCKSKALKVRTSEKIGLLVVTSTIYCSSCMAKLEVKSQITRVWTPTFRERPEALRVHKPLLEIDPNQQDLFEQENKT
ncbi:hypothetical protein ACLSYV_02405 [Avibacterium avium]|uniref:hypothetical protein n=1 Tax=Avibacterium avium TaxID=751 RepID=UPI003BF7CB8F